MNTRSRSARTLNLLPGLLLTLFLSTSVSAETGITITGGFDQTAATSHVSAPNATFGVRLTIRPLHKSSPLAGEKFEISGMPIEVYLGGKFISSHLDRLIIGNGSVVMVLWDGEGQIELDFQGSIHQGATSNPSFVTSRYELTRGTVITRAGRASFTGALYVRPLQPITPDKMVSICWFDQCDHYIRNRNGFGERSRIVTDLDRADATFRVVRGLTGSCISLESISSPGKYLRQKNGRIMVEANDGGEFAGDASFCQYDGFWGGGFSLMSYSGNGRYVAHSEGAMMLSDRVAGNAFGKAVTFQIKEPLWDPAVTSQAKPALTTQATAAEELDVNSYYRLTNVHVGDGKSLTAKQSSKYSYSVLMEQTSEDNSQLWMFIPAPNGKGYKLASAAFGKEVLVTVEAKAQDTPQALYYESPLIMRKIASGESAGLVLRLKLLGDGYYTLNEGGLSLIPASHPVYRSGDPALVRIPYKDQLGASHVWRLTKVGPIR
jgi:hypothetical protein